MSKIRKIMLKAGVMSSGYHPLEDCNRFYPRKREGLIIRSQEYAAHFKKLLFVSSLVIFQLWAGSQAVSGWEAKCHYFITLDAFHLLPDEIKTLIAPYQKILLAGANEPDKIAYDPIKGKKSLGGRISFNHTDLKSVETEIERLSLALEEELRKPETDLNMVAAMMGQLSHFLGDLNQPFHAVDLLPRGTDEGRHSAFEMLVDGDLFNLVQVTKAGDKSVRCLNGAPFENGYKERARAIAVRSAKYFPKVNVDYRKQSGNTRQLALTVGELWNNSVKDILDFWVTIFMRCGIPMAASHPLETLTTEHPPVPENSPAGQVVPESK